MRLFPRASLYILLLIMFATSSPSLSSERVLHISSAFRAPYILPPDDGIVWSKIKKVGSRIGIEFKFVDTPAARSLLLANSGQLDGDLIRRHDVVENYPDLIQVPTAVITIEISIFSWDPSRRIDAFQDFKLIDSDIIATQIGRKFIERKLHAFHNSIFVSDVEDIFSLLERKRIDYVVLDRLTALDVMGGRFGNTLFEVAPEPLSRVDHYLFLHKKHADLVDPINQELELMSHAVE